MGLAHSPRIVTNGLVFYYDMGNPQKSWKGKPTTNFISSLGDPTAEYARGEFGQYFNFAPIFETNGLVPYTLSFDAKGNIPGNMLVYMQNGSYTKYSFVSQNVTLSTDWQRFTFQNLTPAGPTAAWTANTPNDNRAMLATFTTYGSGRNPVLRNIQLELGSFASPFVNDTRSNTQAVLDLTNNNTVTATSLTYASNNTFSFNGSNYLTVPFNSSLFTFNNEQTILIWMKNEASVAARRNPYNQAYGGAGTITHESNTNFNYFYGTSGVNNTPYTSHTSPFSVTLNETAQIAITRNVSQTAWYKNGTLGNTRANPYGGTVVTGTSPILIGTGYTTGVIGGLYTVQIYNRALSAQEVKQNFNATRSRYGI